MAINKLNNTTAGLAGLLSGVYTGIQNNRTNAIAQAQLANQTKQVGWEDPNRTPTQLDILKAQGGNPLQNAMATLLQSAQKANAPVVQEQIPVGVAPVQQTNTPVPVTPWNPSNDQFYQSNWKKAKADGASGYDPDKQKFFTYH